MVRFECPRHCAVGNALLQLLFDCGSASLQGDGFWHWPGNKGALVRPFASRATSGCIRIAQSRQSVASWSPWRTRGRNPYLGLRAEPALGAPCFGLKPKRLAGMELHAASKGPNGLVQPRVTLLEDNRWNIFGVSQAAKIVYGRESWSRRSEKCYPGSWVIEPSRPNQFFTSSPWSGWWRPPKPSLPADRVWPSGFGT